MFTQLLIPLDGSPHSELAVSYALKLGSRLHLMQVVQSRPLASGGGRHIPHEARQRSEDYLRKLVQRLERPGLTLTWSVEEGEQVAEAVVTCARRVEASAVVMTTQGRTGLGRLLLGSVTERVTRYSPCPVLSARLEVARREFPNVSMTSRPSRLAREPRPVKLSPAT